MLRWSLEVCQAAQKHHPKRQHRLYRTSIAWSGPGMQTGTTCDESCENQILFDRSRIYLRGRSMAQWNRWVQSALRLPTAFIINKGFTLSRKQRWMAIYGYISGVSLEPVPYSTRLSTLAFHRCKDWSRKYSLKWTRCLAYRYKRYQKIFILLEVPRLVKQCSCICCIRRRDRGVGRQYLHRKHLEAMRKFSGLLRCFKRSSKHDSFEKIHQYNIKVESIRKAYMIIKFAKYANNSLIWSFPLTLALRATGAF